MKAEDKEQQQTGVTYRAKLSVLSGNYLFSSINPVSPVYLTASKPVKVE